MNGRSVARLVLALVIVAGVAFLGVGAYNAGVSQGLAQAGQVVAAPGGYAVGPGPYIGGWGYGWGHGPGFGFFGFLGTLFFIFLPSADVAAVTAGADRAAGADPATPGLATTGRPASERFTTNCTGPPVSRGPAATADQATRHPPDRPTPHRSGHPLPHAPTSVIEVGALPFRIDRPQPTMDLR